MAILARQYDHTLLRSTEAGFCTHPLWIQFHEGQRIKVLTRAGAVPGVVTVKSTHLQRGRVANAPVATLDDLWVDVGAESKAEMQRLGIELLDAVVRDAPACLYGDGFMSGQLAAVRVGCAVVAEAAQGTVSNGETIFLLTTLRSFGHDGLEAALRASGRVDEVTLVDQVADAASDSVIQRKLEKPAYLPESTGLTSVTILAPRVRFAGTLVESVQLSDAEELLAAVEKAAGVGTGNFVGVALRGHPSLRLRTLGRPQSAAPTNEIAALLKSLADISGVSGQEREVREAISEALPPWARSLIRTDNEGNLILASSDSPHAPLGRGAVIRALDNSSIAPLPELDRILNIARSQRIPIQVGATNGGTDGSDFVRYGALHVGLSWPGRYSHSPVEVLDLRDLQSLERLIYAIAIAP